MDMKASLVLKMSWIRDIAKTCKYHQHYSCKKQARSGLRAGGKCDGRDVEYDDIWTSFCGAWLKYKSILPFIYSYPLL